jgi:hypothetical protein
MDPSKRGGLAQPHELDNRIVDSSKDDVTRSLKVATRVRIPLGLQRRTSSELERALIASDRDPRVHHRLPVFGRTYLEQALAARIALSTRRRPGPWGSRKARLTNSIGFCSAPMGPRQPYSRVPARCMTPSMSIAHAQGHSRPIRRPLIRRDRDFDIRTRVASRLLDCPMTVPASARAPRRR